MVLSYAVFKAHSTCLFFTHKVTLTSSETPVLESYISDLKPGSLPPSYMTLSKFLNLSVTLLICEAGII